MERPPKAVAGAGTRAVATPKFQIEAKVLGDGALPTRFTISSIKASGDAVSTGLGDRARTNIRTGT